MICAVDFLPHIGCVHSLRAVCVCISVVVVEHFLAATYGRGDCTFVYAMNLLLS